MTFGDGTISDVTVDMIDVKSDLSAFVFGTSTAYYAYTMTTTTPAAPAPAGKAGKAGKNTPAPAPPSPPSPSVTTITSSNAPLVGLYSAGDPTLTLSYLSWLKYFTSISFSNT